MFEKSVCGSRKDLVMEPRSCRRQKSRETVHGKIKLKSRHCGKDLILVFQQRKKMCNSNTEESTVINLDNKSGMCLGRDIARVHLEI